MPWDTLIEWLHPRYPSLEPLLRDPKLKLIDDGRMIPLKHAPRSSSVRKSCSPSPRGQRLEDLSDVKIAYMEANGSISIIFRKHK